MAGMAGGAPPTTSLLPGLAAGLAAKEGAPPPSASQPELAQGTLSGACWFRAYRVISFHRMFRSLEHPRGLEQTGQEV